MLALLAQGAVALEKGNELVVPEGRGRQWSAWAPRKGPRGCQANVFPEG